MKANELRIGNYVLRYGQLEKVYQIRNSGVDFYRGQDKKSIITQSYTYSGIEPVPLTEEWLLKFGFIKKETYFYSYIDSGIELMNIANKYFRGYYRNSPIKIDLQYAHQLQNLYFALTGEELTIKL